MTHFALSRPCFSFLIIANYVKKEATNYKKLWLEDPSRNISKEHLKACATENLPQSKSFICGLKFI